MKRMALVGIAWFAALGCDSDTKGQAPDARQPVRIDAARLADARPRADAFVAPVDAGPLLKCTTEELGLIWDCAQTNCSEDISVACVTAHCALVVLQLSPTCQQCVFGAIGSGGDVQAAVAACLN